jgi:hypothetical protein
VVFPHKISTITNHTYIIPLSVDALGRESSYIP